MKYSSRREKTQDTCETEDVQPRKIQKSVSQLGRCFSDVSAGMPNTNKVLKRREGDDLNEDGGDKLVKR